MAENSRLQDLEDSYRKKMGVPVRKREAKSFDEAREGALAEMADPHQEVGKAQDEAPKYPTMEEVAAKHKKERELGADEAKAALGRRKKAKPEVYSAIE